MHHAANRLERGFRFAPADRPVVERMRRTVAEAA
jgi:hypothetical protein